jgi:hypothetical protein
MNASPHLAPNAPLEFRPGRRDVIPVMNFLELERRVPGIFDPQCVDFPCRSQRRSYTWEGFAETLQFFQVPLPRITERAAPSQLTLFSPRSLRGSEQLKPCKIYLV